MTRYPDRQRQRTPGNTDQQKATDQPASKKSTRRGKLERTYGPVKLADLLVPRIANRYRYCPELGWLNYTGAKWAAVPDDAVLNELVTVVKEYAHAVVDAGPSRDDMLELAEFSRGSTQMHAIKVARSNPLVATPVADFDRRPAEGEPYRFHCSNGWTVELHRDGNRKARKTTPADLNTKVGCAYDPKAKADLARKWWTTYQPIKEVLRFQMQMAVRGLSGMGAERFIAWYGEKGGNGKGTIEGLLEAIAGEYYLKLPIEMLLAKGRSAQEQYRNERAQLRAARLVFADEPEEGSRFAVGEIKALTGGSPVTARENFKAPITFTPRIVLTMVANNRPTWGGDAGMERRYVEIEWPFTMPEQERKESFKDDIAAEASGVLNELLKHWRGDAPVEVPDAIKRQTEVAKRAADIVARFVDDAVTEDVGRRVSQRVLFASYVEWCRQNEERPGSSTRFGSRMAKLGFEKIKSNGTWYTDIDVSEDYRVNV